VQAGGYTLRQRIGHAAVDLHIESLGLEFSHGVGGVPPPVGAAAALSAIAVPAARNVITAATVKLNFLMVAPSMSVSSQLPCWDTTTLAAKDRCSLITL
jgi:hypothetical protein